jgi:hypothetical protein
MTVAELIATLQEHPLDARVVVDGYEDGFDNVVGAIGGTIAETKDSEWWSGRLEDSSPIDPRSFYAVILTSDRRRDKE